MAEHHPQPGAAAHGNKSARKNGTPEPAYGQGWPFTFGSMPGAIRVQAETCLKEQADLLEGMRGMMAQRVSRCHEGAEVAFRTFERICASRDGADALVAYHEWLVGSMGVFMTDISTLQEEATRMTQIGQRTLSAFLPPGLPVKIA